MFFDVALPRRLCFKTQAMSLQGHQHEEGVTLTEGAASGRAHTLSVPASPPGTMQPKTQIEAEP